MPRRLNIVVDAATEAALKRLAKRHPTEAEAVRAAIQDAATKPPTDKRAGELASALREAAGILERGE